MEGKRYTCDEDTFGNVTLTDTETETDIYLQGDDASIFNAEWQAVQKIWCRFYGKGLRRKPFGPFNSYEEHMDCIISQYF